MYDAIAAYFESINTEDWARLATLFHDDAELRGPGTPPRIGGDAVASYFRDALRPYPVHYDEPTREIYAGDTVTVEIHFEGQLANGAPLAFDAVDVFDFVDGRIKRESSWYDSYYVRAMLLEAAASGPPTADVTPARRRYALARAKRGAAFRLGDGRWSEASAWPEGLATRAVLLSAEQLSPAALESAAASQDEKLRPGDALLVRVGRAAPPAPELAGWLADRGVAALALDTDASPADLGIPVGTGWALDDLHADCERHGSWDGFLVSVPAGDLANAMLFR
jgi:ketosteroid isomerase-like protein